MRNLIQLAGGVAVAGVVAAGSTAFTGYGAYTSIATKPHLGGTITQAVTGAELTAMSFTQSGGAISAMVLTFADTADTKTVSVTHNGTLSTSGLAFYCTNVTTLQSTCTVGSDASTPTGSISKISSFSITVS
jgi:hypothetical protein